MGFGLFLLVEILKAANCRHFFLFSSLSDDRFALENGYWTKRYKHANLKFTMMANALNVVHQTYMLGDVKVHVSTLVV